MWAVLQSWICPFSGIGAALPNLQYFVEQGGSMKDFFSKILVDLLAKVIVGLLVAVGALLVASPTLRAWAVSEYLVQKWAVWIFFPMFILVTAAASAWLGRVRGSRAGSGPQNLTLTDGDPTYVPTELEDECIVLIRFSDELGVTVKTMHGVMNEGHAVRDLEYAAEHLIDVGWAEAHYGFLGEKLYVLAGPGLTYAREKNYAAATGTARESLRKALRV
ncbi:hypothetical protein GUF72_00485 [Xanthomonas citri pv. citri]|nr:hypothetical protein AB890_05380 [Xanthomonas citri pv. citri]QOX03941.1 hypothetical protein IG630_05325 [Xanthomonas sp. WG16]QYF43857.1 hypothetical protein HZS93_01133 [Xanthomonas citri]UVG59872.1 hypothetical protein Xdur_005380 [Xanthomonas citri pv. durantae]APR11985.1 hypothetical protein BI314_19310 [Xanthomonas citri pv. citri]